MDFHDLGAASRRDWGLAVFILLWLGILWKNRLRILRCRRRGNRARVGPVAAKTKVKRPRRIYGHGPIVVRLWRLRVLISLGG